MIKRASVALLVAIGLMLFTATAAHAAVRFHKGPTFTDQGTTLNVTGNVSGLGNEDLTAVLDATGVASVQCRNPGGNVAPGQDTTVSVSGSQDDIQVKNGRATFNVTTDEPTIQGQPCPNPQWTAEITDVDFTSATLTLIQGGQTVFQETFTNV